MKEYHLVSSLADETTKRCGEVAEGESSNVVYDFDHEYSIVEVLYELNELEEEIISIVIDTYFDMNDLGVLLAC